MIISYLGSPLALSCCGGRPCISISAAPPPPSCNWYAPAHRNHSYSCTLLGGKLSPLVGSTGPGHNHVCWPTNRGSIILFYYVNHGIYLCRGVGGWEKDWDIDCTSELLAWTALTGSKLQHWLNACQFCSAMINNLPELHVRDFAVHLYCACVPWFPLLLLTSKEVPIK